MIRDVVLAPLISADESSRTGHGLGFLCPSGRFTKTTSSEFHKPSTQWACSWCPLHDDTPKPRTPVLQDGNGFGDQASKEAK